MLKTSRRKFLELGAGAAIVPIVTLRPLEATPATLSTAIRNVVGGEEMMRRSRKAEIVADAAYLILTKPVSFSGHFLIDEEVLRAHGVTDFSPYKYDPSTALQADLFLSR